MDVLYYDYDFKIREDSENFSKSYAEVDFLWKQSSGVLHILFEVFVA